jgi:hypothetical protein
VTDERALAEKFSELFPHLNERQRRMLAAAEAKAFGYGGISAVSRASGLSIPTVRKGIAELAAAPAPAPDQGWSRKPGAGRKPAEVADPGLVAALNALVDAEARGDPESPLRWTTKSTRHLAAALSRAGHQISHSVVADLLVDQGFSLQANAKTVEGKQHPDRDLQFRYINDLATARLRDRQPVVSVDTKKKELVGETPGYANKGREWQRKAQPVKVGVHDFPDPAIGKAIPYGVFDIAANAGWVLVGSDHDTASFAVQSLRRWWQTMGQPAYPHARQLMITADAGGSNSYRNRAWKVELARFATETGLQVTCCHFPPGTSKWNRIEHRLFSAITLNWRGRPLTSHQAVVELIAATTTTSGLTVKAELDHGSYPTGTTTSDEQLAAAGVRGHSFHGEWNYDLGPEPARRAQRHKPRS